MYLWDVPQIALKLICMLNLAMLHSTFELMEGAEVTEELNASPANQTGASGSCKGLRQAHP